MPKTDLAGHMSRLARNILAAGMLVSVLLSSNVTGQQTIVRQAQGTQGKFDAAHWFLPAEELLGFVRIPAGFFVMGSDPTVDRMAFENERWSGQRLQGRLELPDYYIARYEVTVAQYQAFVETSGYHVEAHTLQGDPAHPIRYVSWTDALAYARWLETQLNNSSTTPETLRALLQQGWRITLPSEAEWEKAARGFGSRIYPWGNQPRADRANFNNNTVLPVGSFSCPECAYGLADMSGNVWELTRSPYELYPFDPSNKGRNLDVDALWVMRGGAFSDAANLVRSAVRGGVDPGARRAEIGFRLVLVRGL